MEFVFGIDVEFMSVFDVVSVPRGVSMRIVIRFVEDTQFVMVCDVDSW